MEEPCFAHNPQKIALLTDSCADLSEALRAGKPIFTLPLKIRCGDGEFSDGVDIFVGDIYARQAAGELPQTSLPDGGSVKETLDQIAALGYEKVLAIHLSSGLSGTYNMVRVQGRARDDMEVVVFDSLSGSLGMGAVILQVWEEIQAGAQWKALVEERVPFLLQNTFPYFSVDTLEYLQKGGRIGKIAAFAGTMLNIKPLVGFAKDGQLASVAKVRGRKAVQSKLLDLVRANFQEGRRYNLAVANGGAPEEMEELAAKMQAEFPNYEHLWRGEIDATLSVYISTGVLGAGIQFVD
ncbi:DegV family protein [Pseudoflavonifractor sp. 524-17]|uniref:DegV family protein n=1 Tax=Pseudoflavonifractor sp. 524-17 TaxID=2304577 RepID=UPI00137B1C95|nr:DegV family protein [Pseudoflavonifractor sp. 524-17]NCE63477.1 DegV family protein [Pseudoflavonifractor sp. 524-17]